MYKKILVIVNGNVINGKKLYAKIKEDYENCTNKFNKFELIEKYYNTFLKNDKNEIINTIDLALQKHKNYNLNDLVLMKEENIITDEVFNFEESYKESENIKYHDSIFFMSIYNEKINIKINEATEKQILDESIKEFQDTITRIINLNESKEPFFEISHVEQIMNIVANNHEIKTEIDFILTEFQHLNKNDYIKNNLLDDLINYSNKDKVEKLIQYIIYFIEAYCKNLQIQETEFIQKLKTIYNKLSSKKVVSQDIKDGMEMLTQLNYDINKETSLMQFYEIFYGKEDSITFLKKIKDKNFDIRNLNEFIDENENSQLQSTDIDNLLDIYTFFNNLFDNKDIKTEANFHNIFRIHFESNKNIIINLQVYLNTYGEIIQLFDLYAKNPEVTIQKVYNLIKSSKVNIFLKDDVYIYQIKYSNQKNKEITSSINEIEELKNKIYISSTNTNLIKEEGKEDITQKFKDLIDNIEILTKTLNSLIQTGYPNIINLDLTVEDSIAYKDSDKNMTIKKIIEEYNQKKKAHEKSIKNGYIKCPLLTSFYGKHFIRIYEKIKKINNNNSNTSNLINSMFFNTIKNFNVNYEYKNEKDIIENIINYLEALINLNEVNINEIYSKNKVKNNVNLKPDLYRKVKDNDCSELFNNILKLYINLTGNPPILNNILICNEETNIEQIKAFLYRAILCDEPLLYLITNLECLELSIIQIVINTLKKLYKLKNRNINSYLILYYEKNNSGLARDIEKLIPEKNILNKSLFEKEINNLFNNEIELFSSTFAGYGKTTEIKYKIKDKKGKYYYLPIGGSFKPNYVIKNLENLNLNLENGKETYLHIDLSETDNEDLMNELLFKILILKYYDSKETIFYLGYDINIYIEIPTGFVSFEEKYKILKLFKKTHLDKLKPLILEENASLFQDSPISIVAKTLQLYETKEIRRRNVILDATIDITPKECEVIINKYFNQKNKNYYQKMNFIKMLSYSFKKFAENAYYNPEYNEQIINQPIREITIKNFIELTKIFTCSLYQSILFNENNNYNDFEEIIDNLEKNKKDPFNFEDIKPSLVFFNLDGQSLSIITNCNNIEPEYRQLQAFWNSQNYNQRLTENLKDYKKMNHEQFINEIINIFSLFKLSNDDIKEKCKKLGNYIFVSDNFIKMIRILLNIEAKIPVILMGETGVGKTKLMEMLILLYNLYDKRYCNVEILKQDYGITDIYKELQIHAGITDEEIVSFIDKITQEVKEKGKENVKIWVFLDEINTCNSLGLITEIICNHTYLGKKINDNFIFIAACNPYRKLTDNMKKSGLVYYNMKEKNKLNNLVYTVNPLPHSLLNFVIDFGALKDDDENKYIENNIISILDKIKKDGLTKNISEDELITLRREMINSIIICHKYIKEKNDKSSVSLREIRRFGIFFEDFIKYFEYIKNYYKRLHYSLNLTLYLCYYIRLNDKKYRDELSKQLNIYFDQNFIKIPINEINKITNKMTIEKNKGIALSRVLRENLFTTYICISNNVPLIIIGKPGTSKSLSFQILFNTMKGKYSRDGFFKKKGKIFRYYYQGSETSSSEGIKQVFDRAIKAHLKNKDNKDIIPLVFFDEMGLAERSKNNALKVMHYLLEKDRENAVPFLGISNWKLDASKINRTLSLAIVDYDQKDLEEIGYAIAQDLSNDIYNKYKSFLQTLADTYYIYIESNQNSIKENRDFHGNRDFYNLIKTAMNLLIEKEKIINKKNRKTILTEIGIKSLERNFGGLENSTKTIIEKFEKQYGHKFDKQNKKSHSILDIIKSNITDSISRYLMLISEGDDGSDIIKYLLKSMNKKYIELVGSKFKNDLKSGKYSEEILNTVKYIMETDNVLILRELDMIYASLYDLFNQNFTCIGDKRFARIAFEYAKISSEVNKDFHVIIIVNKNKIEDLKLDPPFLNRFEKHIINYRMLLEKKDITIANTIFEYFHLISSFNNNPNLTIDLERLLINCNINNIEGIIFKIKNKLKIINGPEYEKNLMKEIFNKIVPTFCQDIIASLVSSDIDRKYHQMNKLIIDIYKNTRFYNFESFIEYMKLKKNIIYTFSKITENIFYEGEKIENKQFGTFNRQSTTELIESIKSEKELIDILKVFFGSHNKNLLILRFLENNFNKINSVCHVINNYEKKYEKENKEEKLIIIIIHIKRQLKSSKDTKKKVDLLSFINDDYGQIFIDNLHGKENLDILKVISDQSKIGNLFIKETKFLDNKIYNILSYIKFDLLYETKEFNKKNITLQLTERIMENENVKQLIIKSLGNQSKSIYGIIKETFLSDKMEINDVDFFEVISTKLYEYFSNYLLNIIYDSLKENILLPILENYDILMENNYFENLINEEFEKTNFGVLKKVFEGNKIKICNGFNLPKSKIYLDKLIKYIKDDDIDKRYLNNENKLRKKINEKKIEESKMKFNEELNKLRINIKNEMEKEEYKGFFISIYQDKSNEIANFLLNDYFKYFIIKYLQKVDNYQYNEKLLTFFILIVKIMLNRNNHIYNFKNDINEFIEIILITQGYLEDFKIFFNIFIEFQEYGINIEDQMCKILEEDKIKYEISSRNEEYTEFVNLNIFMIFESLIRSILLFSIVLNKNDKTKFYKYIYSFNSIKDNLEQLNKKYYLFSKELYNLRTIIKILECHNYNMEPFTNNYEKIINNLLEQSIFLYNNDFEHFIQNTLKLVELFDITGNDEFINLLLFIFRHQYKIIFDKDDKLELIKEFLKIYPNLIKNSQLFLSDILREIKPELFNPKINKSKEMLINNFMNLEGKKNYEKCKSILDIYNNNKNIKELNEILLYILENQCWSYFYSILNNHNNQYTEECCEEILLNLSLGYLKEAIKYLYEYKINNDGNMLKKLYSIAYIKTYCYYFVEINYNHFDKCNYENINNIFNDENENNKLTRNMIIIYFLRTYNTKFENYDKFINFNFEEKNMSIFHKILKEKDDNDIKYIFKESFISKNNLDVYKKLSIEINQILDNKILNDSILNEINQNFDFFYCFLVNKFLSFLYSNEKNKFIDKLKLIYEITYDKINFSEEGQILYQYLMNYNLLEKKIFVKISNDPLNQEEFEILLYSFRFILNIQMNNKKCFYNDLLKPNINQFIEKNYIPGTFPFINEFIKSYNELVEEFKIFNKNLGYYICKDCGYLYQVLPCTCPTAEGKCINGHVIGGKNEQCSKKDIRVFPNKKTLDEGKKNDSFSSKTMEEFKTECITPFLKGETTKGILKDYRYNDFERNEPVRNLNNITYRLLNFILYSNLLGAFILNYLKEQEMRNYLIENLMPHTLFGIIKKDWEILKNTLKEIGVENIQIFINMIFDKIIDLMNKLKSINTQEEFESFEKSVNNYILEIIDKKNINKLNEEYQILNKELLSINIQSLKEIIQANYKPSLYSQKEYPDIQYYSISNVYNLNTFIQKFNSSPKNKEKYALIDILINKNEIKKNAINMQNLKNINKLINLLSTVYSYNISRMDAKNKIFKDEINNIIKYYNEMNSIKIKDESQFIEDYVNPFIKSWNNIKYNTVQHGCHVLRDIENGQEPLEMKIENPLNYFLVNEGEIEGLFLVAAYDYFIKSQNDFIDQIMRYNQTSGILSSYKSQLEQEIYIQDATDEEIINIDDKKTKKLNDLIKECSMRNIFKNDDNNEEINYKNYNDIYYNYDYIEEELAKYILPGLKKFKPTIKYVTFMYEGLRGENSSILMIYSNKYIQRELTNEEQKYIKELLERNNKNSKFYNDVFSSLQILMKEIINDNYSQNELIYNIIEKFSKYIKLNEELVKLLEKHRNFGDQKAFTVMTLVPIFEYFEKLCWEDIKKNVLPDYKLELNEEIEDHILDYFNNENEKIINKKDFATSLRKLISRSLAGLRQDIDIDSKRELRQYIERGDLWDIKMMENEKFTKELDKICFEEIKIGHCFNLYNLIEEEENRNNEINTINENHNNNNESEISNNIIINNKIINDKDESEDEDEEREED